MPTDQSIIDLLNDFGDDESNKLFPDLFATSGMMCEQPQYPGYVKSENYGYVHSNQQNSNINHGDNNNNISTFSDYIDAPIKVPTPPMTNINNLSPINNNLYYNTNNNNNNRNPINTNNGHNDTNNSAFNNGYSNNNSFNNISYNNMGNSGNIQTFNHHSQPNHVNAPNNVFVNTVATTTSKATSPPMTSSNNNHNNSNKSPENVSSPDDNDGSPTKLSEKEKHKVRQRVRRSKINVTLDRLKSMVPQCVERENECNQPGSKKKKVDQTQLLELTADYIQQLQDTMAELKRENEFLRIKIQNSPPLHEPQADTISYLAEASFDPSEASSLFGRPSFVQVNTQTPQNTELYSRHGYNYPPTHSTGVMNNAGTNCGQNASYYPNNFDCATSLLAKRNLTQLYNNEIDYELSNTRQPKLISAARVLMAVFVVGLMFYSPISYPSAPLPPIDASVVGRVLQSTTDTFSQSPAVSTNWFFFISISILVKLCMLTFWMFGALLLDHIYVPPAKFVKLAMKENNIGIKKYDQGDYQGCRRHFQKALTLLGRSPNASIWTRMFHIPLELCRQILHLLRIGLWCDGYLVHLHGGQSAMLELARCNHYLFSLNMLSNTLDSHSVLFFLVSLNSAESLYQKPPVLAEVYATMAIALYGILSMPKAYHHLMGKEWDIDDTYTTDKQNAHKKSHSASSNYNNNSNSNNNNNAANETDPSVELSDLAGSLSDDHLSTWSNLASQYLSKSPANNTSNNTDESENVDHTVAYLLFLSSYGTLCSGKLTEVQRQIQHGCDLFLKKGNKNMYFQGQFIISYTHFLRGNYLTSMQKIESIEVSNLGDPRISWWRELLLACCNICLDRPVLERDLITLEALYSKVESHSTFAPSMALLHNSIISLMLLRLGNRRRALDVAIEGLNCLEESAFIGWLFYCGYYLSEVFFTIWEQEKQDSALVMQIGRHCHKLCYCLLKAANECKLARPIAFLVNGRYCLALGKHAKAINYFEQAGVAAHDLDMDTYKVKAECFIEQANYELEHSDIDASLCIV